MLSTVLCLILLVATVNCRAPYAHEIVRGCSGCYVNGVCYKKNQEWKDGCSKKKCDLYPYHFGWRTQVVKTQCPDAYGRCVDHGQRMTDGCYCIIYDNRWSTLCYG